jgi:hypothetical protein
MLRQHRLGHARQMAYVVERPARQAARALALIAKRPPRPVPPSPPPRKKNWREQWISIQRKFIPKKVVMTGPDTFGLFHQVKPANDNKSAFHDGLSFCHRLEKKGWKLLGSGAHSRVLAKGDSKKVIKVGCSADNWMRYVLWGRKHGYEGNFVPKVHSYKYFKGKDRPFYVAVVERMERCSSGCHKEKDSVLLGLFRTAYDNDHARAAMNFLHPGCGDFSDRLYKAANDNKWGMDIHGGNFMVRKDGSWVATDPVHSYGDTPTERIRSRAA